MSESKQSKIFDLPVFNDWREHWKDMPEFTNVNEPPPLITALFKFRNKEDYEEFKELVKKYVYGGEKVFDGMQEKTKKQAWYPLRKKGSKYVYVDGANNES